MTQKEIDRLVNRSELLPELYTKLTEAQALLTEYLNEHHEDGTIAAVGSSIHNLRMLTKQLGERI